MDCDDESSLSAWLDLGLPRRYTSGCIPEGVSRETNEGIYRPTSCRSRQNKMEKWKSSWAPTLISLLFDCGHNGTHYIYLPMSMPSLSTKQYSWTVNQNKPVPKLPLSDILSQPWERYLIQRCRDNKKQRRNTSVGEILFSVRICSSGLDVEGPPNPVC